jgi:TatD DNase family protein
MSLSPFAPALLVDSHAHLDDRRLRTDLIDVLNRAVCAGVGQVLAMGTTATTSTQTVELAEQNRGVFAAVGIHPNDAAEAGPDDWTVITKLVDRPHVVAVGETGLDRYWKRTPFQQQQMWFDRHLRLAYERDLPVVIHCRDCQRDILEQLTMLNRPIRGVMHSFTGSWDEAQAFLDLGLHISFAGMVTFTNKALDELRDVAVRVPIDRLLVETDSPYLSPHPFRGQTNEPARVALTAARIAEIRGMSPPQFAENTTSNAHDLFRLLADVTLKFTNPSNTPN